MKKLAIASHVALIDGKEYDGIGNVVKETLGATDIAFEFVRHSMDGKLPSLITSYLSGDIRNEKRLRGVIARPAPLRYCTEFFAALWYFSFRSRVDVYIGIDPLNAYAAVWLKKLGRIERCIFYTPDYSPQRFGNKLLNKIYHAIDRYCVRNADEVWSVSSRIQDIRRDMGLADSKNILLPNVPPATFERLRKNHHHHHTLVTAGIIDTQIDYEGSIRAVGLLKKAFPDIKLIIIGNGPDEARLKKLVTGLSLEQQVTFTGRLPLAETLQYTSSAGVGLALYTGEWGFNAYGDSTKCREYFFFGLPVVSTDTHATVPEIVEYDAGVITQIGPEQYAKAIESIFDNYDVYAKASSRLGDKYYDSHKKQIVRVTMED